MGGCFYVKRSHCDETGGVGAERWQQKANCQ